MSYRRSHTQMGVAEKYARKWISNYYKQLIFSCEKKLLRRIIGPRLQRQFKALDFACGTARITRVLLDLSLECYGVDISPEMLKVARRDVPDATYWEGDLTDPSDKTGESVKNTGPFDLITSFRFFLNAEPELRLQVLRGLRELLADNGIFIFNIHKNRTSLIGLSKWVKDTVRGRRTQSLSYWYVKQILTQCGFKVVQVRGYAFLTKKLALRVPGWYWSLEFVVGSLPFFRYLGHYVIYVSVKA